MKNIKDKRNKILIAEDSPTQAEQLKYILEKHGYKVIVTKDGREALEKTIKHRPDLVISDIIMPDINGFEFCKKVKSDKHTLNIPVILLTSLSNSEDVIKGLECGADNFLTKPFNETYLLTHIEQILANRNLDDNEQIMVGVKIFLGGQQRIINANQQQMFTLLMSTYEAAAQRNNELEKTQLELKILNEQLEELVDERTEKLTQEINSRKLAELEINQKNEELKKNNAEKDMLFSIIAHDLRAPFNGFIGLTEVMLEDATTFTAAQLNNYSQRLNDSAHNLYQLLENLLEWAQIQKQTITFLPKEINLSSVVSQSTGEMKERALQKGISIVNEIEKEKFIFADEKMIRTIMRNLISNAVKFTHYGGSVGVKSKNLQNGMIEISVSDSGVGISKDKIESLFVVGSNNGTKGTDGELSTGLGLVLCKEFVEMHGGKIHVESVLNKGSVFSFTLTNEHLVEKG